MGRYKLLKLKIRRRTSSLQASCLLPPFYPYQIGKIISVYLLINISIDLTKTYRLFPQQVVKSKPFIEVLTGSMSLVGELFAFFLTVMKEFVEGWIYATNKKKEKGEKERIEKIIPSSFF